jgi:citrate lyase subunit beta/citryl-CoA lyase
MPEIMTEALKVVRRSRLFVPVNREKFVTKAWTRDADCIILDLEDSIAPADKDSARKTVKDALPLVKKGGADVEVRINRGLEEKDLDAVIMPGLSSIFIPKCESAEEIQMIDRMVEELEKERNLPEGKIQFSLIIETAIGVINAESIAKASPRIVQLSVGQADLSVDIGFPRFPEMNFLQFNYASNKVLYAAAAAKVQPSGLGAQDNVDFTSTTMGYEAMLKACRQAFWMGYMGTSVIHPGWIKAANEGFIPPESDIQTARKVKAALDEAYAQGAGSVKVDGRMYDVANMKHVNYTIMRADLIADHVAKKAAAVAAAAA